MTLVTSVCAQPGQGEQTDVALKHSRCPRHAGASTPAVGALAEYPRASLTDSGTALGPSGATRPTVRHFRHGARVAPGLYPAQGTGGVCSVQESYFGGPFQAGLSASGTAVVCGTNRAAARQ